MLCGERERKGEKRTNQLKYEKGSFNALVSATDKSLIPESTAKGFVNSKSIFYDVTIGVLAAPIFLYQNTFF